MLIQFSAENFRSIRDRIVFSMLASKDTEHEGHLIDIGVRDKYLKSGIIYGSNASGKSNILHAFSFMVDYVLTSHEKQLNLPTGRIPFKFDPHTPDEPSAFEVIFQMDQIKYVYGFSATDKKIIDEYLYYYPRGRKAVVFERENTDTYRFTTDIELQENLKERNTDNKLYLSTAANWNYKKALPAFNWFSSCRVLNSKYESAYGIDGSDLLNDQYRAKIAGLLRVADLGIQALAIKDGPTSFAGKLTGILDNVEAVHQIQDEDGVSASYRLNMSEESTGTNTYFRLIGEVEQTLQTGCLLVADEMDAYLHPLLTQYLVSLFNSEEHNPHGAQLIFCSHNTSFIDLDLMRRDQIWFTEKDEHTGVTSLYSLDDFSVRKDAKVQKGYMLGRYGAIPFIQGGLYNGPRQD